MTKEQILKRVIEKAIEGGWKIPFTMEDARHLANEVLYDEYPILSLNGIIFDHSFAKAFWGKNGEDWISWKFGTETGSMRMWYYHLTQLVIAKNRLKYLSKFLK